MVSSFRVTFVDFLNQRLAPELFVEVENVAQSQSLSNYLARTNRGDPATGVYDAATGGKNHRFTRHCCGANLS